MKLLFDEHLSHKLIHRLEDLFPDSAHVKELELMTTPDIKIWQFAKEHQFTIVTKDSDFIDLSDLHGYPPFIIWIRTGNVRVTEIESLLRKHALSILNIFSKNEAGILQLQ